MAPGCVAPLFALPDADMAPFDLRDAISQNVVVLCFYPRDGTPACTRQAIEFSDHESDFSAAGAVVVGISPDDCLTHAAFRDEHGISIRLLSDPDMEVCRLYGVLHRREGCERDIVRRTTVVLDRAGVVRHLIDDVQLRGHAAEVLKLVREIARNR
ncbi:peroxiredoxin [Niveibacterium umoris]|uniref:peroxiredoxin n=1 Tax=Niveibacterium umoris TaxID=1193620 RepID=UPI001FD14D0E|nr:peroxiredoxin [Niveibacterium umoris]